MLAGASALGQSPAMALAFSFFLFTFLPPLGAAFAAQIVLAREARHRLRRWTAALWVAAFTIVTSWEGPGSLLGLALLMLLVLGIAFVVAYGGAWLGSAAALRLKRLGQREAPG